MKLSEAFDIKFNDKPVISLVGGGGKTTIMFRLAQELRSRSMRVLVATTTHIYHPERALYDNFFRWSDIKRDTVEMSVLGQASISVIANGLTGDNKLIGICRENVDEIYKSGVFDTIIIEADGSKGRPVKAPGSHEPVIPGSTTLLVGVVGLDCLGKPIGPDWAHRPEILASLTGRTMGDVIDGEVIERLVSSRNGLFKDCPEKAERILFFNKADSPELVLAAERIRNDVLKQNQGTGKVLIGRASDEEPVISAAARRV